ncbi:MAG: hypothetical protein HY791_03890 [Deltaproteobacteria bacterium]|nr:hypothetical protein [Deltaproteobacteria bacterium]
MTPRFGSVSTILVLTGVACARDDRIFVVLPESTEPKAMIVAIRTVARLRIVALEPEIERQFVLSADEAERSIIEAVFYREPLQDLGLMPGELEASPGDPPKRGIPARAGAQIHEARLDGGAVSDWTPKSALSPMVQDFRFAGLDPADPCPPYQLIEIPIDLAGASTAFAVSEDAVVVLTGTTTDAPSPLGFRITKNEVEPIRIRSEPGGPPRFGLEVSAIDPTGQIWLAGPGPYLARARVNGNELVLSDAGRIDDLSGFVRWLSVTTLDGEPEIFVQTGGGRIHRVYRGRSELIYDFGGDDTLGGGIAAIGSGHALAVNRVTPTLLRYRNGRAEIESLPLGAFDRPIVLSALPGFGGLIGTDDGSVLVDRGMGWKPLEGEATSPGLSVGAFAPYPSGFAFVAGYDDTSALVRVLDSGEVCRTELGIGRTMRNLVQVRDGFVTFPRNSQAPTPVFWLSRYSPS